MLLRFKRKRKSMTECYRRKNVKVILLIYIKLLKYNLVCEIHLTLIPHQFLEASISKYQFC